MSSARAQAGVLWSEDLNDGQSYDGIIVRNPFRQDAEQFPTKQDHRQTRGDQR